MSSTLLNQPQAAAGTKSAEYRGAQTPADFGDVAAEFAALRTGMAIYSLNWRAKLMVTGADRVRWMNGVVTNNVKDLPLDQGCYNFLLNAQGRILADLYVYNRGDYLLIDTDRSQAAKLAEVLDRFIIMDDVQVESVADKIAAFGVRGAESKKLLKAIGIEIPELQPLQLVDAVLNSRGLTVCRGAAQLGEAYEIWSSPEAFSSLWEALAAGGAHPVGSEAFDLDRIARGIPVYGQDIRERDLPQETAQRHALHFQKGCYVGQEIVERIHSRGNVHRTFTGFEFSGTLPEVGAKLQKDGKDIGEVTSVASVPLPRGARHLGLGYARREASAPGAGLTIAGSGDTATVRNLPFENL